MLRVPILKRLLKNVLSHACTTVINDYTLVGAYIQTSRVLVTGMETPTQDLASPQNVFHHKSKDVLIQHSMESV